MNVAVTRARRHCALVCDSATVSSDPFLRGLVEYTSEHGQVCSAAEYAPGDEAVVVVRGGSHESFPGHTLPRRGKGAQLRGQKGAESVGMDRKQLFLAVRGVMRQFIRLLCESSGADASATSLWQSLEGRSLRPSDPALASVLPAAALSLSPLDVDARELTMHFPPVMSSFQRMMVHAVASRAGLAHGSTGEGAGVRHVWVRGSSAECSSVIDADDDELVWAAIEEEGGQLVAQEEEHASTTTGVSAAAARSALGANVDRASALTTSALSVASVSLVGGGKAGVVHDSATRGMTAAVAAHSAVPAVLPTTEYRTPLDSPASAPAAANAPAPSEAKPARPVVSGNSLLGDLALARKARAAEAAASARPATADEREAAELRAAVVMGGSGGSLAASDSSAATSKKKAKEKKKVSVPPPLPPAGDAPSIAVTRHGGAEKREFGLPVGGVKPVPLVTTAAGAVASKGQGAAAASAAPSNASASKKKKGKGAGAAAAEGGSDEDMALLDAMVAESRVCAALRCKKSVLGLSTVCRHCRMRFCYEHGLPEAHGCGDAVRAAVRAAWTGGAGMASLTGEPSTATGKGAKK